MFEQLFESGTIALLMLAVIAAEALFFARHFAKFPGIILGLGAGAAMVLALRAALLHQGWLVVWGFVCLSLVFHLAEIWSWLRLTRQ
jgi:hypothetical protein